jgi:hypothetical protein
MICWNRAFSVELLRRFILGDLCVRYTALVDRHLPAIASCVADPSPLVRGVLAHVLVLFGLCNHRAL